MMRWSSVENRKQFQKKIEQTQDLSEFLSASLLFLENIDNVEKLQLCNKISNLNSLENEDLQYLNKVIKMQQINEEVVFSDFKLFELMEKLKGVIFLKK